MTQGDDRQPAKDLLEALDQSFEREKTLEQRDDEEKAVRYEETLTRLKDVDPPPGE